MVISNLDCAEGALHMLVQVGSVAGEGGNLSIPTDGNEIACVLTGAAAGLWRHWKSSSVARSGHRLDHGKGKTSTAHWVGMHAVPGNATSTGEQELWRTWLQAIWAKIDLSGFGTQSKFPHAVNAVECRKGKTGECFPLAMLLYPFRPQSWLS